MQTLYWDQTLSSSEIGKRLGLTARRVRELMEERGIPRRSMSEAMKLAPLPHRKLPSKGELERLYWVEGLSTVKIGKMFSVASKNVNARLRSYGIPLRTIAQTRHGIKYPRTNTQPEQFFGELCKRLDLPFKYVGDGSFWVERINPDFVAVDNRKLAVEIFGDYWHSLTRNKRSETEEGKREILAKYGWDLVVFWESELAREDAESLVLGRLEHKK